MNSYPDFRSARGTSAETAGRNARELTSNAIVSVKGLNHWVGKKPEPPTPG
jgi:hypothetical protein